jgi:hypothetical protein
MSDTPPLVATAAGVPQRADPLPLAPAMAVAGQLRTSEDADARVGLTALGAGRLRARWMTVDTERR